MVLTDKLMQQHFANYGDLLFLTCDRGAAEISQKKIAEHTMDDLIEKMIDAKSGASRRVGSSPTFRTILWVFSFNR